MEIWINVWGYPLNIRAMPLFSWPAFVIPAYEWTILFSGLSAAFGMIALNGLPQLYHPLFNAPNFRDGATTDKFFLCLEAHDPTLLSRPKPGRSSSSSRRSLLWRSTTNAEIRDARDEKRDASFEVQKAMRAAVLVTATASMLVLAGCRQDMQDQPKFFPQRGTTFYADGRSVRPQVENTVARSQLHEDSLLLYRAGEWQRRRRSADRPDRRHHGARPGAVQRLLHAVPLARRQRRRHDRAARLPAGGQLPHGRGCAMRRSDTSSR